MGWGGVGWGGVVGERFKLERILEKMYELFMNGAHP